MSTTTKQSCSTELFGLDWEDFFIKNGLTIGVDTITSSVWTVSSGSKGNEFIDDAVTSLFIIGGTPGVDLIAENFIEINGGTYKDCRKIFITVT